MNLASFDREVIPAGEEASITIEYEPATVGDFSFEIEIASSDEDESPYNIEVKGTAEAVQPDDEPIVEQTRTSHIIHNFLTRRADIITTNDPDLTSRLTGRATGGDRGDGSFGLTGDGISTRMNFSAATSLSRLMRPPSMPPQGRLMVGELSGGGSGGSGYGIAKSSGAVDLLDPLSLGSSTNGLTPNANLSGEQAYGLVPDPDAPKPHEGPQAGAVHDPSQSPGLPLNLTPGAEPPADSGPAFDVWMKTTFAYHDGGDEGNGAAAAGLLFVGADYLVDQYAVVGMLAQLDWMEEENKSENYSVEGIGWMVGPYLVTQLFDEVMLDARFAYGLSSNDINPEGTYEDTFETTRWLARAQLTGQMQVGRLSVKPHVRVLYFEEMQDAYTDSSVDQKLVPEQTISLGRVSFGPTVSYQHTTDRGITIEPSLGIQGLWDFEPSDLVDLDSGLSYESAEDIRARVDAGLTLSEAKGLSISVSSFYDGIGVGDVESYGGSFAVRIPLN